LAGVVAERLVVVAAPLALDDLLAPGATDDGAVRDFEIAGSIDMACDVAADARGRLHVDRLAEAVDVARDVGGLADVDAVAEAVEVAGDTSICEDHILAGAEHGAADGSLDRDRLGARHEIPRDV